MTGHFDADASGGTARRRLPYSFMLHPFFGEQLAACCAQQTGFPDRRNPADAQRRAALETLYRRERDSVRAYLIFTVGRDHACDLAQEVFIRAAGSPELTRLRNPSGFLFRIARNLSIDHARQRQRGIVTVPLCEDQQACAQADQEHWIDARETETRLASALASLPVKTARIFRMNRFEQKSYREIRDELGIALSTVDYHMMRALAHLRSAIEANRCCRAVSGRSLEK